MSDCIFCMVAKGEIPSKVVYEDEDILAFDDIAPQAPVHVLVIPKKHYANLSDSVPADLLGRLFSVAAAVAKDKGVSESGYRVIVNSGADASQTVHHLHVHIIGGKPMSHGMVSFMDRS